METYEETTSITENVYFENMNLYDDMYFDVYIWDVFSPFDLKKINNQL